MTEDTSPQSLTIDALEVVQSQLLLQVAERNEHLKQCLDRIAAVSYFTANGDVQLDAPVDDQSSHLVFESTDEVHPIGLESLSSILCYNHDTTMHICSLKFENCYMTETIHSQELASRLIQLQKQTQRTFHKLENDPMVGNMKHSALVKISERLLRTSTYDEKRAYVTKWNDSLRQTISEIEKVESNEFQWQNFDMWAKRCELQVKLYSYETLSESIRKTIHPLVGLENKYLAAAAHRRILCLKVRWLQQ